MGVFDAEDLDGAALRALLERGEAKATFKHLALAHVDGRRTILAGLGARAAFDPERARIAAAVVQRRARELGSRHLCWELPGGAGPEIAGGLVEGTVLGAYRFTRYRPDPEDPPPEQLTISAPGVPGAAEAVAARRSTGGRPEPGARPRQPGAQRPHPHRPGRPRAGARRTP